MQMDMQIVLRILKAAEDPDYSGVRIPSKAAEQGTLNYYIALCHQDGLIFACRVAQTSPALGRVCWCRDSYGRVMTYWASYMVYRARGDN